MNCVTFRQRLEPFLDDELDVNDNVLVLEHVTACAACQQVYQAERRMRDAVRARLLAEKCPESSARRALAAVRADAAPRSASRVLRWLPPAAAAAAVVVTALVTRGGADLPHGAGTAAHPPGPRITFASERLHDHGNHGDFLAWAGARYDELVADLPPRQVLTAAALRRVEPDSRGVAQIDEFENVVRAELGRDFNLPPAFLEGGRFAGGELLRWHEGFVQQVLVEFGDREIALYEISGCQAKRLNCEFTKLFSSLHMVESDPARRFKIAACRDCDCVLVLRSNRTYLLLSRHGRDWDDDWLVERAKKLVE